MRRRFSERRYRRFVDQGAAGVLCTSAKDGTIFEANEALVHILGYDSLEELKTQRTTEFYADPVEREVMVRLLRERRHLVGYEVRWRRKDGSQIWCLTNVSLQRRPQGDVLEGTIIDVTDRRRVDRIRRATYRISEAAQSPVSLEQFFHLAHEVVSDLMPAVNFYIALVDPASGYLSFPYFVDEFDPPPAPKPMGRGLTDYVIRTGESLLASPDVFEGLVTRGDVELIGAPSVDWLGAPLKTPDGTIGAVVVQTYTEGIRFRDADRDLLTFVSSQLALVIQRKRSEEALRRSEADLKEAQRAAHVGSWDWDARTDTVTWSEELCRIYGIEAVSVPSTFKDFLSRFVRPEGREHLQSLVEKSLRTGEPYRFETQLHHSDGTKRWLSATGEARREAGGRIVGLRGTVQDITERKLAEERSWHQAHYDALTSLPNRLLFNDRLEVAIQRAQREHQRLAIMFLDLDDFKQVNDTLGHSAGDELLVLVGERLRRALRREDTVARLGGDEFLILLNGARDADRVAVMARKILAVFENPFVAKKRDIFLSGSLGIALCPDDGSNPEALMANVDTAMYRAKKTGRNTFQFFTTEMQRHAQERAALESGLRRALRREELSLHYQPIRELSTGRIVSLEALVRWQHPERGLLLPRTFVNVAEDLGLIVPLGAWVLRRACERIRAWRERGAGPLTVAVNLSARQIQHEDFARWVLQILRETGLPPEALDLEITESIAMQSVETTRKVLGQLSEKGLRISIDDFGTGHSSLSYLKHFPIHRLKVDRSFIDGMARDARDRAIVAGVLSIAHSLGVRVVAEGVETEEQASILVALGCDEAQGFLFGKPAPESEIEKLLPG